MQTKYDRDFFVTPWDFLFAVVQIVQPCCKVNIATEKVKQNVAHVNIAYVSHNVIFIALNHIAIKVSAAIT